MTARTYVVEGLEYDDGTPVTFRADETKKLSLRSLVRRATNRVDRPDITHRYEEPVTDHDWRERDEAQMSAFEFARDELTNFCELAEPWICDADREPWICQNCTEVRRTARETDEDQDYGLLVGCKTCLENARILHKRLRLLQLGVAAWIASRWPDLPIDGDRCDHQGFRPKELTAAVRGLTHVPNARAS